MPGSFRGAMNSSLNTWRHRHRSLLLLVNCCTMCNQGSCFTHLEHKLQLFKEIFYIDLKEIVTQYMELNTSLYLCPFHHSWMPQWPKPETWNSLPVLYVCGKVPNTCPSSTTIPVTVPGRWMESESARTQTGTPIRNAVIPSRNSTAPPQCWPLCCIPDNLKYNAVHDISRAHSSCFIGT